jgi:hypothetical protein
MERGFCLSADLAVDADGCDRSGTRKRRRQPLDVMIIVGAIDGRVCIRSMMWLEVSMDDVRVMPIVRLRVVHMFGRQ